MVVLPPTAVTPSTPNGEELNCNGKANYRKMNPGSQHVTARSLSGKCSSNNPPVPHGLFGWGEQTPL